MSEVKQATAQKGTINGVDVDDLFNTIDAVGDQPQIAKFRFRAENEWKDGALNTSRINSYDGACEEHRRTTDFEFHNDEPPVLLGKDRGANPVEYALHALAGCLTTSLVYHAAARGVKLNSVESRLEGDIDLHGFLNLDPAVRNGYEQVRIVFKVDADAPQETIDELIEVAQQRSPVYDIFSNAVPVQVTRQS